MQQTNFLSIHSNEKEYLSDFISESIQFFYKELFLYIKLNSDDNILRYANESTLAGLYVNGLIRNDNPETPEITAVQEYTISSENSSSILKPDIFLRRESDAIWIECKYDKYRPKYNASHFDLENWMKFDQDILRQVNSYYNIEGGQANPSYTNHYVVTMAFKLIDKDRESHLKKCEAMRTEIEGAERNCYYAVEFLQDDNGNYTNEGLEVYGTFEKKK